MPLFMSNYKGHFVYLRMPRTRRSVDMDQPIEVRIKKWNTKGTRSMCVACMLKNIQGRTASSKRLEHFITMPDNTHEIVLGELARN